MSLADTMMNAGARVLMSTEVCPPLSASVSCRALFACAVSDAASIAWRGLSFVRFEMDTLEHVMNDRRQHYARQHQEHDTGQ